MRYYETERVKRNRRLARLAKVAISMVALTLLDYAGVPLLILVVPALLVGSYFADTFVDAR